MTVPCKSPYRHKNSPTYSSDFHHMSDKACLNMTQHVVKENMTLGKDQFINL